VADRDLLVLAKRWRLVTTFDLPALLVGGFGAALGHRWGAYVLIGNVMLQISARLIVGTAAYREVMARPWPEVVPLDDDPWEE
jgi:hypothetical protein